MECVDLFLGNSSCKSKFRAKEFGDEKKKNAELFLKKLADLKLEQSEDNLSYKKSQVQSEKES